MSDMMTAMFASLTFNSQQFYFHTFAFITHFSFDSLNAFLTYVWHRLFSFAQGRKVGVRDLFAHNWQVEKHPRNQAPTHPPPIARLRLTPFHRFPGRTAHPEKTGQKCLPPLLTAAFPTMNALSQSTFTQRT